ncbi:MAG: hypothetical protein CM15mP12_1020 [Gammaproteobacteria bacterium]|nr:MAG: hypothetical protein CM15mP12_1020 [Gammaproteobacteria bacterium]
MFVGTDKSMHTSNLIAYAAPVFTFLILAVSIRLFQKQNNYRLNDTFTSLSLGMISRFPSYLRLGVQGLVYAWDLSILQFRYLRFIRCLRLVIAFVFTI